MEEVSGDYVYDRMICEFNHWDVCLKGLIEVDGQKMFCEVVESEDYENLVYHIFPVAWDDVCDEYLKDYKESYHHWFHNRDHMGDMGCSNRETYDGRPLDWFTEKWQKCNPIAERVIRE